MMHVCNVYLCWLFVLWIIFVDVHFVQLSCVHVRLCCLLWNSPKHIFMDFSGDIFRLYISKKLQEDLPDKEVLAENHYLKGRQTPQKLMDKRKERKEISWGWSVPKAL